MYRNTSNTRDEASSGPHPLPVDPPSLPSSLPRTGSPPSSLQNGVEDADNPSSVLADKFAHLKITRMQQYVAHSNSERAEKLKALPGCQDIRSLGLESIALWRKSFELTDQEYLFDDLRPVESLKKKTNTELVQTQFESLVNFTANIKSSCVELQNFRKPFDDLASAKHTTVSQQVEAAIKLRKELTENAKSLGKHGNIILACHSDIWKFQQTSVKETKNQIESAVDSEQDYQEGLQFRLDMLKDGERIAPRVREPSGLAATFLEGVGKYGLLKLTKRYRNKFLGSQMQQSAYEREKSKADSLDQKLEESADCLHEADQIWLELNNRVYYNGFLVVNRFCAHDPDVTFVALANELDEVEGKLLIIIELIEEFLAQITQEYGLKFCTREVKRLCSRLPNIFIALEMLLSAKEVVANDYQYIYEEHIYQLCKAISEYFNTMQEVHWECRITVNVERQAAFLKDDVPKFQNDTTPHLQGIIDIAEAHISKAKSKEAYEKRAKSDRHRDDSTLARSGRPLVTGEEILWAVHKVIDALSLIQVVSRASTTPGETAGEKDNCTDEAAVEDSLAWSSMPREMMNQFFAVLFKEAEKLRFLQDKRQPTAKPNSNEEPAGPFALLRRFKLSRKPH